MAIYNATSCFVVVTIHGRRCQLAHRYESWVQYRSGRPRLRVDLRPLADELNQTEAGGRWSFDGVDALTPRLTLEGDAESTIDPDAFLQAVRRHLDASLPAWDPFFPVFQPDAMALVAHHSPNHQALPAGLAG